MHPSRTIDLTVDSDWEDDGPDDKDIVQITFEEFNKSQVALLLTLFLLDPDQTTLTD